jgi:hypothetical protein
VRGRLYHTRIEVSYLGGTLPDDERDAVRHALLARLPDLSVLVAPGRHQILRVAATVRADNPREALARLGAVLDQALLRTGLFEQFDVTGAVLRVAPVERAAAIDLG